MANKIFFTLFVSMIVFVFYGLNKSFDEKEETRKFNEKHYTEFCYNIDAFTRCRFVKEYSYLGNFVEVEWLDGESELLSMNHIVIIRNPKEQ